MSFEAVSCAYTGFHRHDDENFEKDIGDGTKGSFLVMFTIQKCQFCKRLDPFLDVIGRENRNTDLKAICVDW